jgi:type I restriction enzyme S subunit
MGPFGSDIKTDNYVSSGVPIIRGGNLTSGRFNPDAGFVYLTKEKADSLGKANAYPDDVLITHRGTLGQVGIIPKGNYDRYVVSQSLLRLKIKTHEAHPFYVYYFLKSPIGQYRLLANTSQTGVPAISQPVTSIRAIKIPLPPLPVQRRIADILGTLDDKIELNRRMNATLEAMARALFKAWFVDFEPVRAKLDGRWQRGQSLPGLPAHLYDLFPDQLVDSELGEIPEGWGVGRLDDVLTLQRGFDLPTPNRTHGIYPVMAASGPNGCHDKFMVHGPGVTTGRSGVLGRVFFIHGDFWPLNTSLWVKEFKQVSPSYAFHLLQSLNFEIFNSGSAVPTLNRNHVHNLQVLIPPKNIVDAFDAQVMQLMKRQKTNETQSLVLTDLRDTLLPKLLSGEVEV